MHFYWNIVKIQILSDFSPVWDVLKLYSELAVKTVASLFNTTLPVAMSN